ncbi:MAG TPA: glutamine synthetase family protein [Desulfobacteria bacterium]|nr:glutamine synthetase family protein [Desulfobacteria bacterium]
MADWKAHVQQVVRDHQIHTVRVCLHDNSNVPRSRYVPIRHFMEMIGEESISFPSALFSLDTSARLVVEAGDGYAAGYPSWMLKPDLSTFGILPYVPGTARVIADLFAADEPVKTAPRQVLRGVLQEFEREGYRIMGAFEYEFYVFTRTEDGLKPVWQGLQCFSEIKQSQVTDILNSVMFALNDMGAGPEVANTEYGSGQFEISNSPFWGLEIADMAFYYRTSIKEILQQKGYTATFMSKPVTDSNGSGAHVHHSLFDEAGNNLFYDPAKPDGLSDLCRWFIGGQLQHAAALCALSNPTINSYKRLKPYSFAPTTPSWGYDHRCAMIRVPQSRGKQTRLENRLPGADTNPYLTLAGILAAGLDGIRNRVEPAEPLGNKDPYQGEMTLPSSLPDALLALKADPLFESMLGQEFFHHYLTLRRAEWERFMQHTTDWEVNEYLELF